MRTSTVSLAAEGVNGSPSTVRMMRARKPSAPLPSTHTRSIRTPDRAEGVSMNDQVFLIDVTRALSLRVR